jgi:hypothetical protein
MTLYIGQNSCEVEAHFIGDKLKWDKPNCKGWQDDVLSHYTVDFHKNKLIYLDQDETFLVVDDDFKEVTINVTNICGETATLATVTNYNKIYGQSGDDMNVVHEDIFSNGGGLVATADTYYIVMYVAIVLRVLF